MTNEMITVMRKIALAAVIAGCAGLMSAAPKMVPPASRRLMQHITTRAITPPTDISMPPLIMTMVREQATSIREALLLRISKSCCGLLKPPPQMRMARIYIAKKMHIVMVIRSLVSVICSLDFKVFLFIRLPPPFQVLLLCGPWSTSSSSY